MHMGLAMVMDLIVVDIQYGGLLIWNSRANARNPEMARKRTSTRNHPTYTKAYSLYSIHSKHSHQLTRHGHPPRTNGRGRKKQRPLNGRSGDSMRSESVVGLDIRSMEAIWLMLNDFRTHALTYKSAIF